MGPGFIFPCAGGRAPFPTDFSSAGGQDYSPRLSRRLEGKLAKIREGRRRLAAQGPPNQRQGRGRNPALPLCARCAPAAPLRGFFKAPFQPRQSRASRTLPGGSSSQSPLSCGEVWGRCIVSGVTSQFAMVVLRRARGPFLALPCSLGFRLASSATGSARLCPPLRKRPSLLSCRRLRNAPPCFGPFAVWGCGS